jgi:hypothetical protein
VVFFQCIKLFVPLIVPLNPLLWLHSKNYYFSSKVFLFL